MRYTQVSFDDNKFQKLRITLNDMVCIERYLEKNPLSIFGSIPEIRDLAYIIFIGLSHYNEDLTLDDVYDIIDDYELSVEYLSKLILTLFTDMGYLERPTEDKEEVTDSDNTTVSSEEKVKTFEESMIELSKNFTLVGDIEEFWDSNLEEVTGKFEGYRKKLKSKSESDYMLAMMISTNVGLMLNGKASKTPSVEEYFPGLYTREEIEERDHEVRTNRAMRNMSKYVSDFNNYQQAKAEGLVK